MIIQWLRALALPDKDLGSVPSPHMEAHNFWQLQFLGPNGPLLPSMGTAHTCIHYTHIKWISKQLNTTKPLKAVVVSVCFPRPVC